MASSLHLLIKDVDGVSLLVQKPIVTTAMMYGMFKEDDVAAHVKTPSFQLRNEALQDFLKV